MPFIRTTLPEGADIKWLARELDARSYSDLLDENGEWLVNVNDAEAAMVVIEEYEPRYLAKLKRDTWNTIKTIRDGYEAAAAPTPFGAVDSDDRSKVKILGLVQMAILALQSGAPFEEEFTLANNEVILLDAHKAIALGKAAGGYVSAVYARARALRNLVNAAPDRATLAAIDINSGWPA